MCDAGNSNFPSTCTQVQVDADIGRQTSTIVQVVSMQTLSMGATSVSDRAALFSSDGSQEPTLIQTAQSLVMTYSTQRQAATLEFHQQCQTVPQLELTTAVVNVFWQMKR